MAGSGKRKYSGPRTLEELIRLIHIEIRRVVIGTIMADFYVDNDGNLVYNENGMYDFNITDDGYLEWEERGNG